MKTKLLFLSLIFISFLSNSQVSIQNIAPQDISEIISAKFINNNVGFITYTTKIPGQVFLSRTLNGGDNWVIMDTILLPVYDGTIGEFSFINNDTGFAFSSYTYRRTFNGGTTWDSFKMPDSFMISMVGQDLQPYIFINKYKSTTKDIFIYGTCLNSGKHQSLKSLDYNNHWILIDTGLYSIQFIDSMNIIGRGIYVKDPLCNSLSQLIKTNNGGKTWVCDNASDTFYDVRYFCFPAKDTGYAYRANRGLLKTTDGGISWKLMNNGLFSPVNYECPIAFPSSKVGYLLSPQWQLYQTRDGGNNWIMIYNFSITQPNGIDLYSFQEDTAYLLLTEDINYHNIYKVISLPLDIDTKQLISSLQIYPNPVNSDLKIEWSNPNRERFDISIYDELGRIFYHSSCNDDFKTIDVSNWAKGIYTIKIQFQNSIAIKKIIIN